MSHLSAAFVSDRTIQRDEASQRYILNRSPTEILFLRVLLPPQPPVSLGRVLRRDRSPVSPVTACDRLVVGLLLDRETDPGAERAMAEHVLL